MDEQHTTALLAGLLDPVRAEGLIQLEDFIQYYTEKGQEPFYGDALRYMPFLGNLIRYEETETLRRAANNLFYGDPRINPFHPTAPPSDENIGLNASIIAKQIVNDKWRETDPYIMKILEGGLESLKFGTEMLAGGLISRLGIAGAGKLATAAGGARIAQTLDKLRRSYHALSEMEKAGKLGQTVANQLIRAVSTGLGVEATSIAGVDPLRGYYAARARPRFAVSFPDTKEGTPQIEGVFVPEATQAWKEAVADLFIETVSEFTGPMLEKVFGPWLSAVKGQVLAGNRALPAGNTFRNYIGKAFSTLLGREPSSSEFTNILRRMGFHGLLQEWGEERVADLLHGLIGRWVGEGDLGAIGLFLSGQWKALLEQQAEEIGVLAVGGAFQTGTAKLLESTWLYYKPRAAYLDALQRNLQNAQYVGDLLDNLDQARHTTTIPDEFFSLRKVPSRKEWEQYHLNDLLGVEAASRGDRLHGYKVVRELTNMIELARQFQTEPRSQQITDAQLAASGSLMRAIVRAFEEHERNPVGIDRVLFSYVFPRSIMERWTRLMQYDQLKNVEDQRKADLAVITGRMQQALDIATRIAEDAERFHSPLAGAVSETLRLLPQADVPNKWRRAVSRFVQQPITPQSFYGLFGMLSQAAVADQTRKEAFQKAISKLASEAVGNPKTLLAIHNGIALSLGLRNAVIVDPKTNTLPLAMITPPWAYPTAIDAAAGYLEDAYDLTRDNTGAIKLAARPQRRGYDLRSYRLIRDRDIVQKLVEYYRQFVPQAAPAAPRGTPAGPTDTGAPSTPDIAQIEEDTTAQPVTTEADITTAPEPVVPPTEETAVTTTTTAPEPVVTEPASTTAVPQPVTVLESPETADIKQPVVSTTEATTQPPITVTAPAQPQAVEEPPPSTTIGQDTTAPVEPSLRQPAGPPPEQPAPKESDVVIDQEQKPQKIPPVVAVKDIVGFDNFESAASQEAALTEIIRTYAKTERALPSLTELRKMLLKVTTIAEEEYQRQQSERPPLEWFIGEYATNVAIPEIYKGQLSLDKSKRVVIQIPTNPLFLEEHEYSWYQLTGMHAWKLFIYYGYVYAQTERLKQLYESPDITDPKYARSEREHLYITAYDLIAIQTAIKAFVPSQEEMAQALHDPESKEEPDMPTTIIPVVEADIVARQYLMRFDISGPRSYNLVIDYHPNNDVSAFVRSIYSQVAALSNRGRGILPETYSEGGVNIKDWQLRNILSYLYWRLAHDYITARRQGKSLGLSVFSGMGAGSGIRLDFGRLAAVAIDGGRTDTPSLTLGRYSADTIFPPVAPDRATVVTIAPTVHIGARQFDTTRGPVGRYLPATITSTSRQRPSESLPPLSFHNLKQEYGEHVNDIQLENVFTLLHHLRLYPHGGVLLQDSTGTGKTRQIVMLANELAKWGKTVLIVAPLNVLGNPFVADFDAEKGYALRGGYKRDAEVLGVLNDIRGFASLDELETLQRNAPKGPGAKRIYFTSYNRLELMTRTKGAKGRPTVGELTMKLQQLLGAADDVVYIFDEAHLLKNTRDSATAVKAMALVERSRHILVTATPIDRLAHLDYVRSAIMGLPREAHSIWTVYNILGLEYNSRDKRITLSRKNTWMNVHARLEMLIRMAGRRGGIIGRQMRPLNVLFAPQITSYPSTALADYNMLRSILVKAYGDNAALINAQLFLLGRLYFEHYKVDSAVQLAKRAIEQGRKVIVYANRTQKGNLLALWASEAKYEVTINKETGQVEGLSEKPLTLQERNNPHILQRRQLLDRLSLPTLQALHNLAVPSTLELLSDRLVQEGIPQKQIATFYGGTEQEIRPTILESFQSDDPKSIKAILANPLTGGIGLNLDDTRGNTPRTLILMTPPLTATELVQILGRVDRITTVSRPESPTTIHFIVDPQYPVNRHVMEILTEKFQHLGVVVRSQLTASLSLTEAAHMGRAPQRAIDASSTQPAPAEPEIKTDVEGTPVAKDTVTPRTVEDVSSTAKEQAKVTVSPGPRTMSEHQTPLLTLPPTPFESLPQYHELAADLTILPTGVHGIRHYAQSEERDFEIRSDQVVRGRYVIRSIEDLQTPFLVNIEPDRTSGIRYDHGKPMTDRVKLVRNPHFPQELFDVFYGAPNVEEQLSRDIAQALSRHVGEAKLADSAYSPPRLPTRPLLEEPNWKLRIPLITEDGYVLGNPEVILAFRAVKLMNVAEFRAWAVYASGENPEPYYSWLDPDKRHMIQEFGLTTDLGFEIFAEDAIAHVPVLMAQVRNAQTLVPRSTRELVDVEAHIDQRLATVAQIPESDASTLADRDPRPQDSILEFPHFPEAKYLSGTIRTGETPTWLERPGKSLHLEEFIAFVNRVLDEWRDIVKRYPDLNDPSRIPIFAEQKELEGRNYDRSDNFLDTTASAWSHWNKYFADTKVTAKGFRTGFAPIVLSKAITPAILSEETVQTVAKWPKRKKNLAFDTLTVRLEWNPRYPPTLLALAQKTFDLESLATKVKNLMPVVLSQFSKKKAVPLIDKCVITRDGVMLGHDIVLSDFLAVQLFVTTYYGANRIKTLMDTTVVEDVTLHGAQGLRDTIKEWLGTIDESWLLARIPTELGITHPFILYSVLVASGYTVVPPEHSYTSRRAQYTVIPTAPYEPVSTLPTDIRLTSAAVPSGEAGRVPFQATIQHAQSVTPIKGNTTEVMLPNGDIVQARYELLLSSDIGTPLNNVPHYIPLIQQYLAKEDYSLLGRQWMSAVELYGSSILDTYMKRVRDYYDITSKNLLYGPPIVNSDYLPVSNAMLLSVILSFTHGAPPATDRTKYAQWRDVYARIHGAWTAHIETILPEVGIAPDSPAVRKLLQAARDSTSRKTLRSWKYPIIVRTLDENTSMDQQLVIARSTFQTLGRVSIVSDLWRNLDASDNARTQAQETAKQYAIPATTVRSIVTDSVPKVSPARIYGQLLHYNEREMLVNEIRPYLSEYLPHSMPIALGLLGSWEDMLTVPRIVSQVYSTHFTTLQNSDDIVNAIDYFFRGSTHPMQQRGYFHPFGWPAITEDGFVLSGHYLIHVLSALKTLMAEQGQDEVLKSMHLESHVKELYKWFDEHFVKVHYSPEAYLKDVPLPVVVFKVARTHPISPILFTAITEAVPIEEVTRAPIRSLTEGADTARKTTLADPTYKHAHLRDRELIRIGDIHVPIVIRLASGNQLPADLIATPLGHIITPIVPVFSTVSIKGANVPMVQYAKNMSYPHDSVFPEHADVFTIWQSHVFDAGWYDYSRNVTVWNARDVGTVMDTIPITSKEGVLLSRFKVVHDLLALLHQTDVASTLKDILLRYLGSLDQALERYNLELKTVIAVAMERIQRLKARQLDLHQVVVPVRVLKTSYADNIARQLVHESLGYVAPSADLAYTSEETMPEDVAEKLRPCD